MYAWFANAPDSKPGFPSLPGHPSQEPAEVFNPSLIGWHFKLGSMINYKMRPAGIWDGTGTTLRAAVTLQVGVMFIARIKGPIVLKSL